MIDGEVQQGIRQHLQTSSEHQNDPMVTKDGCSHVSYASHVSCQPQILGSYQLAIILLGALIPLFRLTGISVKLQNVLDGATGVPCHSQTKAAICNDTGLGVSVSLRGYWVMRGTGLLIALL